MRAIVAILFLALSAAAHHSLTVDYDTSRPITLTGKVTKVEWRNPHVFFHVDAKDPKTNKLQSWAMELGSLNSLVKLGWTQNTLKIGYNVTAEGIRTIDGRSMVLVRSVTIRGSGQKLQTQYD